MIKLTIWACLILLALGLGPEATLVIKDNTASPELSKKVFNLQATTFSEQPLSARHSLIHIVIANPISACQELQLPPVDSTISAFYPVYYLVQGREGECTYSRKVHFARKALARGIIIVDSLKGTNNLNSRLNRNNFHIYLMPESEGDFIINAMGSSTNFLAQLDLVSPTSNKVEIWVSSLNVRSYDVLEWWIETLREVPAFSQKVDWKPRFAFTSCTQSNTCGEFVSSCACGGDFCSPEAHGKTSNVLVREDIRQMLLFNDNPEIYLSYILQFHRSCLESYLASQYAEDCADRILGGLDVSAGNLSQRIDSFLLTCGAQSEGMGLYEQMTLDRKKAAKLGHYPTVLVNHEEVPTTNQKELKGALCKKLGMEQEDGCRQEVTIIEESSSVLSWVFWFIMIVVLVGAGVLVVFYFGNRLRREMNKQLKMQMSTAMEHYFSLSETSHASK